MGTTQAKLNSPRNFALDTTATPPILYISDLSNNRILGYYNYPFLQSGAPADFVIGQTDFTSSTSGTTDSTLNLPMGIAVDSAGNLWVADKNNHRVLVFNSPTTTDFKADYVLMVAEIYSADRDAERAVIRLTFLGDPSPVNSVENAMVFAVETGYGPEDLRKLRDLSDALAPLTPPTEGNSP